MKPQIKKLSHADNIHLQAAEGWLGLGDFVSASNELEEITAQERAHPAVLSMRYAIYAKAQRWDMAAEVADGLMAMPPDVPDIRVKDISDVNTLRIEIKCLPHYLEVMDGSVELVINDSIPIVFEIPKQDDNRPNEVMPDTCSNTTPFVILAFLTNSPIVNVEK